MKTLILIALFSVAMAGCGKADDKSYSAFKCGYSLTVHEDSSFDYSPGTFERACVYNGGPTDVVEAWRGLYWASQNHDCTFWATTDGKILNPQLGIDAHAAPNIVRCETQDRQGHGGK